MEMHLVDRETWGEVVGQNGIKWLQCRSIAQASMLQLDGDAAAWYLTPDPSSR